MRPADTARLVALAAIWGASFIFIRVTAPVLGPVWVTEGRVLIGGLALAAWFAVTGFDPQWRRHLKFYAIIGLINSAVPFSLYGFAGMHLSASVMSILNATAPMFGLLLGSALAGERITARKIAGLVAGLAGAQFCGALALAPFLPLVPPVSMPDAAVLANLAALGILASAIALVLHFRLMIDIGPTRTLTVTYLIPLFGMLWGVLFLGEILTAPVIAGGALILAGTVLVTRG